MHDTIDVIEEQRFLSALSDRVHHFTAGKKKYTCYAGVVVPYNIGTVLILWALTGSRAYASLLEDHQEIMDEIRLMNPNEKTLSQSNDSAAYQLCRKLRNIMSTWEPEHFEDVVPAETIVPEV
jgi:hypothetical protein